MQRTVEEIKLYFKRTSLTVVYSTLFSNLLESTTVPVGRGGNMAACLYLSFILGAHSDQS